jgi:hypothetical protein
MAISITEPMFAGYAVRNYYCVRAVSYPAYHLVNPALRPSELSALWRSGDLRCVLCNEPLIPDLRSKSSFVRQFVITEDVL